MSRAGRVAVAAHAGRQIVLVSGAPGAGKSTLAGPLATELRFALLSKDRIKETLHDEFGAPEPDLAWSHRVGGAAMELLWVLAADLPAVVLEANFRPRSEYERARIAGLGGQLVEVYCHCPAELAIARYTDRAAGCHPVHVVTTMSPEFVAQFDRPVGLGELVVVDTTGPADVPAVAAQVRACLARAAAGDLSRRFWPWRLAPSLTRFILQESLPL